MEATNVSRQFALQLIQQKDQLEKEIKELGDYLLSQKGVGLHEPLVDSEGYPRADIDLYQVRHARHRLICLQNDLKVLMKQIEESIHVLHASERVEGTEPMVIDKTTENTEAKPFASITFVAKNSPAHNAGLLTGDYVIQFGSVTVENFKSLQNIASVVEHSVRRSIPLTVMRQKKIIHLHLTPNTWQGKGLLGCTLLPVDS